MECHHNQSNQRKNNVLRIFSAVSILIVGYYIWTEHRAHLISALPYLLLLACPLMHLFMMGSHGGHSHGQDRGGSDASLPQQPSQTAQR